ncbi:hypothetical protein COW46_00805 [Candidatus Gracilibacteria bacterium CG17_big_fil_post_rev_8_21_14_2_50_48_13]|nr:MAG: hypothetical protein COW46_00805 [Candidatus Gracilibacteria bacterium CG17_big_fil_post_rev_8_21_14_2_50_48_13]
MIQHLSPSSIIDYATDRQMFYKKWIRKERDSKTWLGTIIGSVVHQVLDSHISAGGKADMYAEQYIADQVKLFQTGAIVLNDCDNVEDFQREVRSGVYRVLPNALSYINTTFAQSKLLTEVTYRTQIGSAVGMTPTQLPVKCIVDVVDTKHHVLYDYKVVKEYKDDQAVRLVQAVINALNYAEHTGQLPEKFVFVEMLRLPTLEDKLTEYEANLLLWEQQKAAGEKVAKPRKPTGKPKPRLREMVITLEEWQIKVVMQLIKNIVDELHGINIMAEGRAIPNLTPKYSAEGWEDFCTSVLGYNPYNGEVRPGARVDQPITVDDLPF